MTMMGIKQVAGSPTAIAYTHIMDPPTPLLCRVIVSIPICRGTRRQQLGKLYATKPNTTCQGESAY